MKRNRRTRKESKAISRRQPGTSSNQGQGSPVAQANETQMDCQSHVRQCLSTDAPLKALREQDYQSCLKECIRQFSDKEDVVVMYKGYPQPSEKSWAGCLRTAREFAGKNADALDFMCAYELLLVDRDIATVPALLSLDFCLGSDRALFKVVRAKHLWKQAKRNQILIRNLRKECIAAGLREGMSRSEIQLELSRVC